MTSGQCVGCACFRSSPLPRSGKHVSNSYSFSSNVLYRSQWNCTFTRQVFVAIYFTGRAGDHCGLWPCSVRFGSDTLASVGGAFGHNRKADAVGGAAVNAATFGRLPIPPAPSLLRTFSSNR